MICCRTDDPSRRLSLDRAENFTFQAGGIILGGRIISFHFISFHFFFFDSCMNVLKICEKKFVKMKGWIKYKR